MTLLMSSAVVAEEEVEAEVDDLLGADFDIKGLVEGFIWWLTLDLHSQ